MVYDEVILDPRVDELYHARTSDLAVWPARLSVFGSLPVFSVHGPPALIPHLFLFRLFDTDHCNWSRVRSFWNVLDNLRLIVSTHQISLRASHFKKCAFGDSRVHHLGFLRHRCVTLFDISMSRLRNHKRAVAFVGGDHKVPSSRGPAANFDGKWR